MLRIGSLGENDGSIYQKMYFSITIPTYASVGGYLYSSMTLCLNSMASKLRYAWLDAQMTLCHVFLKGSKTRICWNIPAELLNQLKENN